MEIKKLSRRKFFKASALFAGALVTVSNRPGLLSTALAANPDDAITKQNYIHDVTAGEFKSDKDEKKYNKHAKKISKALEKAAKKEKKTVEEMYPSASDLKPMCLYCKHYKDAKDGYGNCAMVGATGDKKVFEKGWCKVWAINKKEVLAAAAK